MSGGRLGVPEALRGIARVCLRPSPGTPRGCRLPSHTTRAPREPRRARPAPGRLCVRSPRPACPRSRQRPPPVALEAAAPPRACVLVWRKGVSLPRVVTGVCVTTPSSVSVLNSCWRRHRPFLWGWQFPRLACTSADTSKRTGFQRGLVFLAERGVLSPPLCEGVLPRVRPHAGPSGPGARAASAPPGQAAGPRSSPL